MNDVLSDSLDPGDPLHAAAQALRDPVPVADGFPERVARRRTRRQREKRFMVGAGALAAVAAISLALRPASSERQVTFALDAPMSRSVALVGDFTDWRSDEIQLTQRDTGKWEVTVKLPPGRYRFAYLVDNDEWRADSAAAMIPDDFGRPTSVVTVTLDL